MTSNIQKIVAIIFATIFPIGCAHDQREFAKHRSDYSIPTRRDLIDRTPAKSLIEVSSEAKERLGLSLILAGEDTESISFDLAVVLAKKSDDELVNFSANLPKTDLGSLFYFIEVKDDVKKSHPKFFKLIDLYKPTNSPAVLITERDQKIN